MNWQVASRPEAQVSSHYDEFAILGSALRMRIIENCRVEAATAS